MRYDLTQIFSDLEGNPILMSEKPLTLGMAIAVAGLNASPQTYDNGIKKYPVYLLIKKVTKGAGDLSSEDVVLAKDLAGAFFTSYISGLIWDALEQKDVNS